DPFSYGGSGDDGSGSSAGYGGSGTSSGRQPYGGYLGNGFGSAARALGDVGAANSLSPQGVSFDSDGNPYRAVDSGGLDTDAFDPDLGSFDSATSDPFDPLGTDGFSPSVSPALDTGGLGGGGLGGGSGLGGAGGVSPAGLGGGAGAANVGQFGAGASALMAVASPSAGLAGAGGSAAGMGAAASGLGRTGMPMMPMMPMGGMGGGGAGNNGNRGPAWLVEIDDHWGVETVVTSSVIGNAPPPAKGGR
ncbi:MAG: hypothetical protein ACRCZP_12635, partial [Phycicoccus sp.]